LGQLIFLEQRFSLKPAGLRWFELLIRQIYALLVEIEPAG
jgi:hypothetical protein